MEKVVIYARYSSDRQTEQSIEGQLTVCQSFIERNNFKLVGTYIDRAISGTTDHRPDFQKMIKDSEKGLFKYIIVYKLDRFARNRYDSAIYKNTLRKNGVKVLSASENISDSPEGIIMEGLLESMAEYYSAELSQKIRRGQVESLKKKNTLGGLVPFGYKTIDKKYFIDEEKAPIVRDIFQMYLEDKPVTEIAAILKSRGVKNAYNRFICPNSIMNMLKCQKYIGIYKFGDSEVQDYMPKIIDEKTFNDVQEKISKNQRAPGAAKANVRYLLSGKLYCGHCKTLMIAEGGTGRGNKVYRYYSCSNRKSKLGKQKCDKKIVPKDWLENYVVNRTRKHIFENNFYKKMIDKLVNLYNEEFSNDEILKTLESNYTKTKNEINNIINSIKAGIFSTALQNELSSLENQLQELEIQISRQKIMNKPLTREHFEFWFEQFKNVDEHDEKAREFFIDTFIHKVILYDKEIIIIYNNSDDDQEKLSLEELENMASYENLDMKKEHSETENVSNALRVVEVEGLEPSSKKRKTTPSTCASLFCFLTQNFKQTKSF